MAQNDSGIFGTVKNYIPGLSTEEQQNTSAGESTRNDVPDTHQRQTPPNTGGGILSYIPGFGGFSTNNNDGTGGADKTEQDAVDEAPHTRSGTVYGKHENYTAAQPHDSSSVRTTAGGGSKYGQDSDTAPVDTDTGYGAGKDAATYGEDSDRLTHRANEGQFGPKAGYGTGTGRAGGESHHRTQTETTRPNVGSGYNRSEGDEDFSRGANKSAYGGHNPTDGNKYGGSGSSHGEGSAYGGSESAYGGSNPTRSSDYGSRSSGHNSGRTGNLTGERYTADRTEADNGVRGSPIEGDNVKGYAVSAPVGTGDVSKLSLGGDPSGQVSGAHMEYGPTTTDTRDATGRGTVGNTTGDGDSSFANVKRTTASGTEHVVAQSSSSRIQHSSVTQM